MELLIYLGEGGGGGGAVVSEGHPVLLGGGQTVEGDLVLGGLPGEGVLVEAGGAGDGAGGRGGGVRLEGAADPLEGLEVDEVAGGLLVLQRHEGGELLHAPGEGQRGLLHHEGGGGGQGREGLGGVDWVGVGVVEGVVWVGGGRGHEAQQAEPVIMSSCHHMSCHAT